MIQRFLPSHRGQAPKKKPRGLRRYFRNVLTKAESYSLEVSDHEWWDYWHYHPDRYGRGNLSWPMRARHLEALAKAYDSFAQQLQQFGRPYQLWISLDVDDAAYDAVFVHSQNPNSDDFPAELPTGSRGVEDIARYFEGLLPGYRFSAGRWSDAKGYYVYSPDVGVPLEKLGSGGS